MKFIRFILLLLFSLQLIQAQSLEPRLYSNAPVGLNFLVIGYSYSNGALPNIPSLGLKDPNLTVDTGFLAYARVFEAFGQSGKFDIILPFAKVHGTAYDNANKLLQRDVTGVADTKLRLSYNFFGAPALSMKKYAAYKQKTIIGSSLQITIPTGNYDATKLVNISTNRWAIKPSIGISQALGRFILEADIDAEFYTANNDYFGHTERKQDPLYSTQIHLIYNFNKGAWFGLDANYFWGGDYKIDGVYAQKQLENSRMGLTVALPLNKTNSIKLYGSRGVVSRIGTNFDIVGFAWQYHWF
jgi:hypothetical protein